MDINVFEEIVSENRYETYSQVEGFTSPKERKREYERYHKCPRCGEWKLAANVHQKRQKESKGFLRGSKTVWRTVDRWWECKNCKSKFDVVEPEDSQIHEADEEEELVTNTENNEASDVDDTEEGLKKYELDFIHANGVTTDMPITGGEKAFVQRGKVVVPSKSAKFRLPQDHDCSEGEEVRMTKKGDSIFCVVENDS